MSWPHCEQWVEGALRSSNEDSTPTESMKSGNKNATAKGGEVARGAAGGDRTHDPWLRRPILYPLSYSRINQKLIISCDAALAFISSGEAAALRLTCSHGKVCTL